MDTEDTFVLTMLIISGVMLALLIVTWVVTIRLNKMRSQKGKVAKPKDQKSTSKKPPWLASNK